MKYEVGSTYHALVVAVVPIMSARAVEQTVLQERDEFGKTEPQVAQDSHEHSETDRPSVGDDVNAENEAASERRDQIRKDPF